MSADTRIISGGFAGVKQPYDFHNLTHTAELDIILTMQSRVRELQFPSCAAPADYMHIGQVANVTGLTQRTIRYYEELGLLPAPERTQGDFRLYTLQDVRRLSEIARLKELFGFTLAEIKEIIMSGEAHHKLMNELALSGGTATQLENLRHFETLAAAQLAVLDRKLALMSEMKSEMESRLAEYRERIEVLTMGLSGGSS